MPKTHHHAFAIVLALLPLAGCPCLWDPAQCKVIDPKEIESMLEKALAELHQQPSLWQTTFTNLIQQLEKSGSNLVAQIKDVSESMLGQATGEFSCRVDFVGNRAAQRLQAIAHSVNPQRFALPEVSPVICSTNPSGPLKPGDPANKFIKFFGYDLKMLASHAPYRAVLRYSRDGEIVLDPAGFISTPHDYMVMLDIQSPAVQSAMTSMDPSRGPQLVLLWEDKMVQTDPSKESAESALAIEIPVVPPQNQPHEVVAKLGPFGGSSDGNWGAWQPLALCPMGTWAIGASLRIEKSQGGDDDEDDTALNGIRLSCGNVSNPGNLTEISSAEGWWGEWEGMGSCGSSYVTGARLRIEPKQGGGDDTGAVDADFTCASGSVLHGQTHHNWGDWRALRSCPVGSAVCGLEALIEPKQGRDRDDTAMNDAQFACCKVW